MKQLFFILYIIYPICISAQNPQLLRIAESGDIDAQLYLAESYMLGRDEIKRNLVEAKRWYEKAAANGSAEGEYGIYKVMRIAKDEDVAGALRHLGKAADMGCKDAKYLMGRTWMQTKDYKRALHVWTELEKEKFIPAFYYLGECYFYGYGTNKNIEKALDYYISAYENGVMESLPMIAACYVEKKNYVDAVQCYKRAIEEKIPTAFWGLALLYAEGMGVEQNYQEAHFLLDRAIRLFPDDSEYFLMRKGELYVKEGDSGRAREIWNKVIDLNPMAIESQSPLAIAMTNEIDNKIPENRISSNKSFVLIIANEEYTQVENVPFAFNDGEIFERYCQKTLGVPQTNIKRIANATLNNIRTGLSWLEQIADAYNGEANIIFYYAGHGIPNESNGSAYLLPVDGVGNDVTTGYSLDKLYADLGSKPAKSVIVLLDACFSGARRDGGMLASARGVAIKAKQNAPKGNMVVLSAAQGDETAYPYKDKGHGLFTYYLLKKLQESKGDVTLGELADYVTAEVKKQSVVVNGKMQTPLASPSNNATDWRNWKLR